MSFYEKVSPFLSEKEIQERIEQLAKEINEYYGDHPVYVIGILKGSFLFLADLVRRFRFPVVIEFMTVSSYGESLESSGVVKIVKDIDVPLRNRRVLVIEDIADTRYSLNAIDRILQARHPKEIKYCVLLDKTERKKVDFLLDWVGFEIPDRFVVGYGLDYAERYRQLPFIGVYRQ